MFCFTVRKGKVQAMTEREELMLYHGIMIGTMASGCLPPKWAAPWIAEVSKRYDDAARNEIAEIVKNELIDAVMRTQGN